MRRPLAPLAPFLLQLLAGAAPAELSVQPDWASLAGVGTVQVLTENEDGTRLDTKVWVVVLDEQGYVRTGDTRWGRNIERDPEIEVRIEGTEYPLHVYFVEDEGLRQRITDAFREKYGFTDALLGLFRGSGARIMRLSGR